MKFLCFCSSICLGFSCVVGNAVAEDIRWATRVVPESNYPAVGVPDFRSTRHDGVSVEGFGTPHRYGDLNTLDASLADVQIRSGYLIAIEGNGGHGAGEEEGWESSRWRFSDDQNPTGVEYLYNENKTVAENNTENGVDAVVDSGPIVGEAFPRFFYMCCRPAGSEYQGFIIFDLAAMNIDSNSVSVFVEGWHDTHTGEGTPDPDAFGIVDDCRQEEGICALAR